MSKFYKRIESIIVILLIAGGIFLVLKNSRKPTEMIKEQISSVISSFDFSDVQSLYNVYKIAELGEEAIPDLQGMIDGESIFERWAAIITLSSLLRENQNLKDTIIPSLKQALDDENDTLKMLAAAQLLSFGEKEGFPVLISCLSSEEIAYFGEPPELVKERSLIYLQHFTDYDGKTIKEWQGWWENNEDLLSWDETLEIFEREKKL